MPGVIPRDDHQSSSRLNSTSTWVVPIVVGLVLACVLGFIASYPLASAVHKAASTETTGSVTTGLAAADPAPKKRVRYEATIENWKRYRAAHPSE